MKESNRHRHPSERIDIQESGNIDRSDLVVIKGTGMLRIGKYDHMMAIVDFYVAVHTFLDWFKIEMALGPNGELVADCGIGYQGNTFYIEMDLGNMEAGRLIDKIDRYIRLARTGEKVIFVLRDGMYKAQATGTSLLAYGKERRLGNFCTATLFENIIKYPLGDVIHSPKDGRVSLAQLCSNS